MMTEEEKTKALAAEISEGYAECNRRLDTINRLLDGTDRRYWDAEEGVEEEDHGKY